MSLFAAFCKFAFVALCKETEVVAAGPFLKVKVIFLDQCACILKLQVGLTKLLQRELQSQRINVRKS